MLTIHRYFDATLSKQDLKYEPLYTFDDSWKLTISWFKENWLPEYHAQTNSSKDNSVTKICNKKD